MLLAGTPSVSDISIWPIIIFLALLAFTAAILVGEKQDDHDDDLRGPGD